MNKFFLSIVFFGASFIISKAQKIIALKVEPEKQNNLLEVPVNIDLDEIAFIPDSSLTLLEIDGKNKTSSIERICFKSF